MLSLVTLILLHPVLDHGFLRRVILTLLTFVPLVVATSKLSQRKGWLWSSILLMIVGWTAGGAYYFIVPSPTLLATQWAALTVVFGLAVSGLFSYLRHARVVDNGHLYTAASIYLLLAMLWLGLYSLTEAIHPGSFERLGAPADRSSDLLYFSLVTLTTLGYGDILPASGEVRMLAALEAVAGVFYIAITVALLINAYRWGDGQTKS